MESDIYSSSVRDIIFDKDTHVKSIRQIYNYGFKQYTMCEQHVNALTTRISEDLIKNCIKKAESSQNSILKGLPVLIKDLFLTKDFVTTEGVASYTNFTSENDAEVVKKIKDGGGIILGKTNVPPMGMDYQTFNPVFGTTKNPFDQSRTPGGSSGGSAVAIACDYAPFAIGSDLGGSLRLPAAFTGIVSLRPTQDNLPINGHLSLTKPLIHQNQLVTLGPMAKTVDLISVLYQVIQGCSEQNLAKVISKPATEVKILVSPAISGLEVDHRISSSIKTFSDTLKEHGIAIMTRQPKLSNKLISATYKALYNIQNGQLSENELPYWEKNQKIIQNEQIELLMTAEADCWMLPVVSTLPIKHNYGHTTISVNKKPLNYWKALGQYCIPFSVSGLPVLTLPIAMINKLPLGVQLVALKSQEKLLFSVAKTLEQVINETKSRE